MVNRLNDKSSKNNSRSSHPMNGKTRAKSDMTGSFRSEEEEDEEPRGFVGFVGGDTAWVSRPGVRDVDTN